MGNVVHNMKQDLMDQWEWAVLQWESVARREAAFLLRVQRHRDTLPLLRPLKLVLSWHPLKDITVIVWIAFLVSLAWIGYTLCFEFMSIAIVSFAANWLMGVRRPSDLDHRIKQLSNISPYAFPSMEITMAAVLSTSMAEAWGTPWGWSVGYAVVAFLCFTRVYAAAYLPHQLVFSWVWGAAGIVLVRYITASIWKKRVPDHWKIVSAFTMFALVACWVAYRAERNASPFMRIPKSEYTRVLTNIMNQEPENNTMGEQEALPATVPASDSDAEFHGARRRRNKVDSFVHMMRSMQRTANRRTEDEASLFG